MKTGIENKRVASRFFKEQGDSFGQEIKELEKDKAMTVDFVETVKNDQVACAKWLTTQQNDYHRWHLANIWENHREFKRHHIWLSDVAYVGNAMNITPHMLDEELRGTQDILEVERAIDQLSFKKGEEEWMAKHLIHQEQLHDKNPTTIYTVEKCMKKAYDRAKDVGDLYHTLQNCAEESIDDKSKMASLLVLCRVVFISFTNDICLFSLSTLEFCLKRMRKYLTWRNKVGRRTRKLFVY